MSAPIVLIDYEQMRQLSQRFQHQADLVNQLHQQLNQTYQTMQVEWQGESAKTFLNEMHTAILPSLGRLNEVLITAQQVTLNVNMLLREAETAAANLFKGSFADRAATGTGKGVYGNPSAKTNDIPSPEYRKVAKPVFAQGAGDSDAIAMDDVKQGSLGDCYLMAGLAAIAKTNPDVIRKAIRDNGDGTYTVTFYPEAESGIKKFFGMRSKVEVTVTNEFAHEQGASDPAFARLSNDAEIWPMLIEKAYAKYKDGYANIERGNAGEFIELLTGNDSVHTDVANVDFADLKRRVDNGDAVTTGTPDSLNNAPRYVYADHAYVVEHVDMNNKTVTLYNPWGKNHPTVTFDEFKANYEQVAVNEKD